jgi:hypothetical protein
LIAQVCAPPAEIERMSSRFLTETGARRLVPVVSPFPSCPDVFAPQQRARPSASSAHACVVPAVTAMISGALVTRLGSALLSVEPSPSCPVVLRPQQRAVASESSAQAWFPPTASPVPLATPVRFCTVAGNGRSPATPVPSCPDAFDPQQRTVPSARSAQVCAKPGATAITFCRLRTGVASMRNSARDPAPSSPLVFRPQQRAEPSAMMRQVWSSPEAMAALWVGSLFESSTDA